MNSVLRSSMQALGLFVLVTGQAIAYSGKPASHQIPENGKVLVTAKLASHQGTRLYLQEGKVTGGNKVQETEPYCYFRVSRNEQAQAEPIVILSDDFTITSILNRRHFTSIAHQKPYLLASLGSESTIAFGGFESNGGGTQFTLATHLKLQSAHQPLVSELVCAIWADPRERRHLTLSEVKTVLGNLVTIDTTEP